MEQEALKLWDISDMNIGDVEKREKIVYEYYITIGGEKFNLSDLQETLEGIEDRSIYFNYPYIGVGPPAAKMFLENRIIANRGDRYSPCEIGENFKEFYQAISKIFDKEMRENE